MSRKSSVAKKEDPPKRPLSSYFLFLADERENIKKSHPEAKVAEVSAIAGQKWKTIDPAAKAAYEKTHKELKEQYEKDKATYEAKHGPIKNNRKKKEEEPKAAVKKGKK